MQIIDANGNMFGGGSLEIIGIDGKPKVPVIPATLIVNSTPITGGAVGRVLFQGAGNVLQESSNLFWDAVNNRLGIGTTLPLAIIHSVGSVTAATAIARGNYLQPTLVATANNDVLVGLDIQPTFTNGAFTGVTNTALRVNGSITPTIAGNGSLGLAGVPFNNAFFSGIVFSNTYQNYSGDITFSLGYVNAARFFSSTKNFVIQNGGTFTDAGYRLDVNGSVRTTGSISAASAVARGTYLNQTLVATANNDVLVGLDINPTFTTGAFTGVQQENLVIRGNTNPIIRFKNQAGNTTWGQITANASELSFNAGNGSLNFTAGNTIGMYMFTATRNVLIQNGGTFTDAGYRLDVNGTTRLQSTLLVSGATTTTGLITANGGISSSLNGYGVTIGTNAAFSNDTTRLAQSPATWIWHDLFAFNRYNATYETYNGTTWSSATLNTELFAQKQTQSIQVINTTILASRWTFNGTGWGGGQWLVIGVAYDASLATYNVLLESYDGTAWVTRHTSNTSVQANNYFASVSAYSGDNQLRVTITKTGGGNNLNISNIKLLTARPGDQGVGSDVEFPYYWNGTRSIGIGTSSVINASAILDVGSTTKGFLPPRMSNAQMLAIVSPASGLIVYDTTSQKHFGYNGSSWNAFF